MRMAAQIGLSYLLLLLLGAVWRLLPLASFTPDFVSLIAAYLGLTARDRLAPSVAAAVTIGYLADLLYGTPVGLMAMTAGLVCTVCHLIQGRLLVRGWIFTMVFASLTALAAGLFVLAIRGASDLLPLGWGNELGALLSMALITGLLGPFVFRSCRYVDSRFARTPRERDAAASGMIL
jgi:rod shape-determining protein MreD